MDPGTVESLAARLEAAAQTRLGRGLTIRHVNTGSCNGCELELRALSNVLYDLERFGLRFVESPRHADVLLVTGPLTRNLRAALEQAWDATPEPKWVVAVGDCAVDGGFSRAAMRCWAAPDCQFPSTLRSAGARHPRHVYWRACDRCWKRMQRKKRPPPSGGRGSCKQCTTLSL